MPALPAVLENDLLAFSSSSQSAAQTHVGTELSLQVAFAVAVLHHPAAFHMLWEYWVPMLSLQVELQPSLPVVLVVVVNRQFVFQHGTLSPSVAKRKAGLERGLLLQPVSAVALRKHPLALRCNMQNLSVARE